MIPNMDYCTAKTLTYRPEEACVSDREARLMDEFGWAIEELGRVAAEYAERLAPVSQPEYGCTEAVSDSIPHAPYSDARQKLHRLHDITASLRGGLDRLEV